MSSQEIIIICKDNKKIKTIFLQQYSQILQNVISDIGGFEFELQNIKYSIIKQIEKWCKYADIQLNNVEKKKLFQYYIHDFELKLLHTWNKKKMLLEICKAVDYLDISRLYDILCFYIADVLKI